MYLPLNGEEFMVLLPEMVGRLLSKIGLEASLAEEERIRIGAANSASRDFELIVIALWEIYFIFFRFWE